MTVTDEDREAALDYMHSSLYDRVTDPKGSLAQAFARHRMLGQKQANEPTVATVLAYEAGVAEGRRKALEDAAGKADDWGEPILANRIRAMIEGETE